MDPLRRLEAKSLARAKLRARRSRVTAIRRRTIAGSAVLFALAWAVVFAQLVSGNDPVLNRAPASRPVASVQRRQRAEADRQRAAVEPEVETAPVEEEPVLEPEVEAEAEFEAEPEAEFEPEPEEFEAEPEVEFEPEPEPVITASS